MTSTYGPADRAAFLAWRLRDLPEKVRTDCVLVIEAALRDVEGRRHRYRGLPLLWAVLDDDSAAPRVRTEPVTREDLAAGGYPDERGWQGRVLDARGLRGSRCVALVSGDLVSDRMLMPFVPVRDTAVHLRLLHEGVRWPRPEFAFGYAAGVRRFGRIRFEPESRALLRRVWTDGRVPPRQEHIGTILTAYAVDLDRVRSALGSGDRGLLADLVLRFADELRDVSRALGADDGTAARLLGHLVTGEEPEQRSDAGYDHCVEILCAAFGERLGDEPWRPRSASDAAAPAEADATGSVPISVGARTATSGDDFGRLVENGLGLALPAHDGPRGFGGVSRTDIPSLLDALRRERRTWPSLGEEVIAPRGLCSWLETCTERGVDLVCFPY